MFDHMSLWHPQLWQDSCVINYAGISPSWLYVFQDHPQRGQHPSQFLALTRCPNKFIHLHSRIELFKNSIFPRAIRLWNCLSEPIREVNNLEDFIISSIANHVNLYSFMRSVHYKQIIIIIAIIASHIWYFWSIILNLMLSLQYPVRQIMIILAQVAVRPSDQIQFSIASLLLL